MKVSPLRRGDVVEVRSAAEILATLDEHGALDAMPFMPEMVDLCGQRFTVDRRAEKLCDTITGNPKSRRLTDSVYLGDLRCDGSGHAGCQAECRIYWKEAWLRPVRSGEQASPPPDDPEAMRQLRALVERGSIKRAEAPTQFRCQATEMVAATEPLETRELRPYWREYRYGNVGLGHFLLVMARALKMQIQQRLRKLPMPPLKGTSSKTPVTEPLDLQPGEWVRVKSPERLREVLTDKGTNRGLWFDREMMEFCGREMQVRRRVTQIIDERTGEMLHLHNDCVSLENGVCSGEFSTGRWFCPREIYSYFREAWLERVEAPESQGPVAIRRS